MIIRYSISNLNSQNIGSGPRNYIQASTNTRLEHRKLGLGPRKYKHKTQVKGKILTQDKMIFNLKYKFSKPRVGT